MIIGVCGKIASGKSQVLAVFEAMGFYSIDADKIVRDLYKPGAVGSTKIRAIFGDEFILNDGSVDRDKLRNLVFRDEDKRKYLENIIHPEVYSEVARLIEKHRGENIVIESVYFDEGFLADFVDEVLWIERPKADILKTLIDERGFGPELAELAFDIIKKPRKVSNVLNNDVDLTMLREKVRSIYSV